MDKRGCHRLSLIVVLAKTPPAVSAGILHDIVAA
jgi:hypothetical protein